jgi:hypothetical protein
VALNCALLLLGFGLVGAAILVLARKFQAKPS